MDNPTNNLDQLNYYARGLMYFGTDPTWPEIWVAVFVKGWPILTKLDLGLIKLAAYVRMENFIFFYWSYGEFIAWKYFFNYLYKYKL